MYFRVLKRILNIYQYLIALILCSGILFSQDAPESFDFNQSVYQSFYFFLTANLGDIPLVEDEDWIASFNEYDETMGGQCSAIGDDLDDNPETEECKDVNSDGILSQSVDVCVGSIAWDGEYTTVPVMGDDGTRWTNGYMKGPEPFIDCNDDLSICSTDDEWDISMGDNTWTSGEYFSDLNSNGQWDNGQIPKFKIYDGSDDVIYNAVPSVVYPWSTDLAFYVISVSVFEDCNDDLGGEASIDDCGVCTGGNTGLEENYLDIGCGCNNQYIGPFYQDLDGDALGFGEGQYFCQNPGLGWSENNNDPHPDCSVNYFDCNDECGGNATIDDCGICGGGNQSQDCTGICQGDENYGAYFDDCDICVGGSTDLEPCDFESTEPEEFYYEISTQQAFYLVLDAEMWNGLPLSHQDWIGAFNGDVCVGSAQWEGMTTTIPVMGDDGSSWTEGYLNMFDYPTFKLYDASVDEFYDISVTNVFSVDGTDYIGFANLAFYNMNFVVLSPDCNGEPGGLASIDDCGVCSGGNSGIEYNQDLDCSGECFGVSIIDNCGICGGENSNDLGCGCFLEGPEFYYADVDNDGFGFGDIQSFCEDPGDGWSINNLDQEPFCFNQDLNTFNIDDCGICNGGNQNLDCSGICFGVAEFDDCGVCQGDSSSCLSPIANSLELSTNEDEILLINLSGTDPNDIELSFIITSAPANGVLIGDPENPSEYSYTPNQDFYGSDSFTYMVFNGQFYSDEAIVNIEINSINDAPLADNLLVEGLEDLDLFITLTGNDVDGDSLSFLITSTPEYGQAILSDGVIAYSPNQDFYGIDTIEYVTTDGELQSIVAYITIVITGINDAPIAADLEITLYEDSNYSFTFDVSDVDNGADELSIYFIDEIEFGLFDLDGLEANLIPNDDIYGDYSIEFQVLDGSLFSNNATLTVHILPVNDAPVLSTILNQSIDEDEIFYYQLNAFDIDEDELIFSVSDVEFATVNISDQTLTVSPDQDFNGSLLLEISVTDGEYSDIETFLLDVIAVNDPPILVDIDNQTSMEDEIFSIEISASDVDEDLLTYWIDDIDNASVEFSNGLLSISPDNNWNGDILINVNVTDGEYIDSDEFLLEILPVNDPPTIASIESQVMDEDFSFSYLLEGYDVDGDQLSYSISETLNAISYTIQDTIFINPDENFNGTIAVSVSVSDDEYSASTEFELTILPVNDPPTLDVINNQEIYENNFLELNFNASDVDEDDLSYTAYIISGYASVEISENLLLITPSPLWSGLIEIDFIVSDGEYYVQQNFNVNVLEVDDPPTAYDIDNTLEEDNTINVQLISSDPDTDTELLVYSISSEPLNGTLSLNGSIVEYTPAENYNGYDEFSYTVSDALTESDPATSSITIIPINDSPIAQDVEYTLSDEEIIFDLNSVVDDIDGDDIEISFITQNYGSDLISTLFDGVIEDLGENTFSYTPPSGMVFFDFILYKAKDQVSESSIKTISFNLLGREMPRNMAPIAFDQDVSLLEDNITQITLIGFDVLNAISDQATFEITSQPEHGTLSSDFILLDSGSDNLVQWSIDYTPNQNYFGLDSLTYKVTNPDNSIAESNNGTVYINISSQNDPPFIYIDILNQTFMEDANTNQLDLGLFFSDIDGDVLNYDFTSTNSSVANILIENQILSITPLEDQYSSPFSVSITASDTELSVTQFFDVEILPVNDPPIADSKSYEIDEDNSAAIILSGSDIEYDPLSFIIYSSPENGIIQEDGNLLTYQPNENFNGSDSFTYKTSDGDASSELATISILVNPINDAPVLSVLDSQSINEDDTFSLTLLANDVDGDELTYSVSTNDESASYEVSGDLITVTPATDMYGEIEVFIAVSDGTLTDESSFMLTVIAQPDPPELVAISTQEINEDENLIIFLSASDVDGDELFFYGSSILSGSEISVEDNLIMITPPINYYGDMIVSAGVSDGLYSINQEFVVNVLAQPDPPVISAISDQEVLEGVSLSIDIPASDPDGDELIVSVEVSNDINVVIDDLLLTLQSQNNVSGAYEVIVSVSDNIYSAETSFILNVINVNDPPVSYSTSATLDEDDSVVIILNADDPDLDDLTYHIQTFPQFGSINISSGVATYSPGLNYFGEDSFEFYVSDGEEQSNISVVTLNILPINDSPIITSQPILVGTEDELYTYQIVASDPEGDSLTYELSSFPSGMEVDDLGLITWMPLEGVLSSGEVVVTVLDGGEDGALPFSQAFTIDVEAVNDTPQIVSTPSSIAFEDQEYSYQIEILDPDSDTFYYNLLIGPDGLELSDNGLITWTPTEGIISSGTVALVVWDVEIPVQHIDFPAVQEFVITVIPINDPPSIISSPSSNATEDIEYTYQVEVEDIDSDVFYFSLLDAPLGMQINQYSGSLTWTPLEGVLTSGDISIKVADGDNDDALYDIQNFAISVTAVNDSPVIVSTASPYGIQGQEYVYEIQIEDPDDTEFIYLLFNAPSEMQIDYDTGILSWTPPLGGVYGPITLRVQDGGEDFSEPSEEIFSINVQYTSGITTLEIPIHSDANLISYSAIPEDNSIESILFDLGDNILSIITESAAASLNPSFGWVGNLNYIQPQRGYWLVASEDNIPSGTTITHTVEDAFTTPLDFQYLIHEDANLISYVGIDGISVSDALPDSIESNINSIIGEGVAASWSPTFGWVGSLDAFYRNEGYWLINKSEDSLYFSWEMPEEQSLLDKGTITKNEITVPDYLIYNQSSMQSFYFIDNIILEDRAISEDDWIVAYNNGVIVGARRWNGLYTDVPVMGDDGMNYSTGYCQIGDIPIFKLYLDSTGEMINLKVNNITPPWENLSVNTIQLAEQLQIPNTFEISYPYPNPFNPSTSIEFGLPLSSEVVIKAYDIMGRKVETILNKKLNQGYHQVNWNPTELSTGIYFINIKSGENDFTYKVMFIK